MTEVDDDSVFDVDRFLLFGQEGPYPAVLIGLCAVPAVVLVRRDDQLLGGVIFYRFYGVVVDEFAGLQFVTNRVVCLLLLSLGKTFPKPQTFCCFSRYYRAGI